MLRQTCKISSMIVRNVSLSLQQKKQFKINGTKEYVSKVMNSSVPVIVNFHADWCEPCRILTPKLIDIIEPMDELDLAIVDLETNPDLVHMFEVKAVPAIITISSGLVIDKLIGLHDFDTIENLIHKLIHQNTLPSSNSKDDRGKV